nr:MAG TPA: hypothetical protein [Caudoviricetes sp.]
MQNRISFQTDFRRFKFLYDTQINRNLSLGLLLID